jgi:hypothetical protein
MLHRYGQNMAHSSIRFYLLLISVLILLRSSTSFTASLSHHHHRHSLYTLLEAASDSNDNSNCCCDNRRRIFIASSAFATFTVPYFAPTQIAQALQERNEVLCNTGFFTNVGAWYCTDIGNIGDEGKSKELSIEAMSTVDSLLSKFDINNGDFSSSNNDGGTNKGINQRLNAVSSSSRNDLKDDTSKNE